MPIEEATSLANLLDEVPDLNGEIERYRDVPEAGGAFTDVWKGKWTRNGQEESHFAALSLTSTLMVAYYRWQLRPFAT